MIVLTKLLCSSVPESVIPPSRFWAVLEYWTLVTSTLVLPVMVVTALWAEVLPPMMAPATMALSLTVTLVFPVNVVDAPLLFPPMTCSAVAFPESCTWVSPVSVLVWRLVLHSLVTPPEMMPNAPPLMSIQMSPR